MEHEVLTLSHPTDDPWEDLVVAMLSVNSWPIEKTYCYLDNLRSRGLLDPIVLKALNDTQIGGRLKEAGYDRGAFMTNLFALRLTRPGQFVEKNGVDACTKGISGKDPRGIERFLAPVNGIGPKVIANFCVLRGIQ